MGMGIFSVNRLLLIIMVININNNILTVADDEESNCGESRCGENEPPIRFPFRLKDSQPSHCGYPGFDLSCTFYNSTQLMLPLLSGKFYVTDIDYVLQEIQVHDPDRCLPTQLLRQILNLSTDRLTPFKYRYRQNHSSYTVLNCTKCSTHLTYSTLYFALFPLPSNYEIQELANSIYSCCTKIYDVESLPDDVYMLYETIGSSVPLTWSKPDCRGCETKGKGCRLTKDAHAQRDDDDDDDDDGDEIECFHAPNPSKGGISKISTAMVATIGLLTLCFLVVAATFYIHSQAKKDKEGRVRIKNFLEDYIALKPSRYTYADIKKITAQFKYKLGQGAYGAVFKGKLSNDIFVAVKILNNSNEENGEDYFINEVAAMGRIHHLNVVRLVGYCAEGFQRALVYEFMPNDSLDKYMASAAAGGARRSLSLETLQNISLGIAKGMEYLHLGCDQRILHFDIKPHNILLDQDFIPKISDFGLAKLCSKDQSLVSISSARGTIGYIAPEVLSLNFGNVSYKSDVYSFGMLLLKMIGGKKNTNATKEKMDEIFYPEWIYNLLEEGEDFRILIEEERDAKIARKLAIVGLWCIQWHPISRPAMNVVVEMLEGTKETSVPPNPFASKSAFKTNTKIPIRRMTLELEAIVE